MSPESANDSAEQYLHRRRHAEDDDDLRQHAERSWKQTRERERNRLREAWKQRDVRDEQRAAPVSNLMQVSVPTVQMLALLSFRMILFLQTHPPSV